MPITQRRGFSLVELVVVVAIIAILIALMLPAVQKVRAAAARAECASNLRQVGLAAHQYHDSYRAFPAGQRWHEGKDSYAQMGWLAPLLPFLEQQALWNTTVKAFQQTNPLGLVPGLDPPHVGFATVIPTFVCPADGRAFQTHNLPPPPWQTSVTIPVASTNYLGVSGRDLFSPDGVLFRDSSVRIADIKDGTSNTLFAGERPPSPDFRWGRWYAGVGQQWTGSVQLVLGVEELKVDVDSDPPCPPWRYLYTSGNVNNYCDIFHFWSMHPGGANFLFADGSVRLLSYSAAPLLPALASRNSGEVVTLPW